MATVTKTRATTTGAAKTTTKPLGAKTASTSTPVAGKTAAAKVSSVATSKSSKSAAANTTPAPAPTGFMGRLLGGMNAPQSTAGNAPRPGMGRFMIGMVAYLIGSFVIQSLLVFFDVKFKWGLERKNIVTLPLFGPINGVTLIYLLSLAGLLYALYKFRVLPSAASMRPQPAPAKGATAAKGAAARGSLATSKASTAKNATTTKPSAGKVTAATAGANAKIATKKVKTPVVEDDEPGENDDLHAQVRAQMRAQARKRKR